MIKSACSVANPNSYLTAEPGAGGRDGPKSSSSSLLSSSSSAGAGGLSAKDAGGIAGPSTLRRFSAPSESTFFGDWGGRSISSSSESRFLLARCGGSCGPTEDIVAKILCCDDDVVVILRCTKSRSATRKADSTNVYKDHDSPFHTFISMNLTIRNLN